MIALRSNYVVGLACAAALLSACSGSSPLAATPTGASNPARKLSGGTKTFSYTGAKQTFTVPADVTSINITADGAAGGHSEKIGRGGRTQATVPVTPGEKLIVYVGGAGSVEDGGFNGGANGGDPYSWDAGYGGGGASDVRRAGGTLSDRILVAGGGGGQGGVSVRRRSHGDGGKGGGVTGGSGGNGLGDLSGEGGMGGTQSDGGIGGQAGLCETSYGSPGATGTLGAGGAGSPGVQDCAGGGGGGGGYYGGGGGGQGAFYVDGVGYGAGGGGGGSSYAESSATGVHIHQGWNTDTGNGQIVFTWQ